MINNNAPIRVSVIIVSYNVSVYLDQAIRAVKRAALDVPTEIWVVDNASTDTSVAMTAEKHPDVHLIANPHNPGFGIANNQAMEQACGDYFLILNPDTLLHEDFLKVMTQFMDEHPECGAAGPVILDPDGSFSPTCRRAFPRPSVALWRILGLSQRFPKSKIFGQYNMTFLPEDRMAEVDALSGSCMMVRRHALFGDETNKPGVGLFDPAYFMYGEDLDWCFRIQKAGWHIYYTPETTVLHYKGESTDKQSIRYVKLFYGAMVVFMEKHFAGQYAKPFIWLLKLGVHIRASMAALGQWVKKRTNQLPSRTQYEALFIGSEAEASRFRQLIDGQDWQIVGTLSSATDTLPPNIAYQDVVYAEADLAPSQIFSAMQVLHRINVTHYILAAQEGFLIGPAAIHSFSPKVSPNKVASVAVNP
ncbi:MAG: glycosyltransferase family 2 protein [Bacteroidetes Order II. Incertae sedis bacterium]|nr:glycosyltransferase family 2 protein [Bacteroidetes Order II. bacterium]